MNSREKTDYVWVLPFMAHLEFPSCEPNFFSHVSLQYFPLHPSANSYKALNPCLTQTQVLNEDLILNMLICYSPPSGQTCRMTLAEPSFPGKRKV